MVPESNRGKEDIMNSRYSPSWAITSVEGAGKQAGSSYFSILLLALLGENNLSQCFTLFRKPS